MPRFIIVQILPSLNSYSFLLVIVIETKENSTGNQGIKLIPDFSGSVFLIHLDTLFLI